MNLFSFLKKKNGPMTSGGPVPMLRVNERGGALLACGEQNCVWILAPFHDIGAPVYVKGPDVPVEAVIVLNRHREGCLPLTSFFAADASLPAGEIYVSDPANPHDWHPGYPDPQGINALLTVRSLPQEMQIGELRICFHPGDGFVKVERVNPHSGCKTVFYVGTDIRFTEEEEGTFGSRELYFCGNFEEQGFEHTFRAIVNAGVSSAAGKLHIFMCRDWIRGNGENYIQAFNHMGFTVYSSGAPAADMN
ncbi:MAG: hypothetical protein IBJ09_12315 [Bacteroidia bacterium]|nr:hypothetical protein [Bacteroidia bacterium]